MESERDRQIERGGVGEVENESIGSFYSQCDRGSPPPTPPTPPPSARLTEMKVRRGMKGWRDGEREKRERVSILTGWIQWQWQLVY